MKTLHTSLALVAFVALIAATAALSASAQNVAVNAPANERTTTVYRQRMSDGRIVYSDKLLKGAKLERTLPVLASETPRAAEQRERRVANEMRLGRESMPSAGTSGVADGNSRSGR